MNQVSRKLGPCLLFSAAVFGLLLWLIMPAAPAGFDWDDTWYLWMAEWFSSRSDYRDVAWMMMQSRQYPPLFPYLLSHGGEVLNGHTAGLVMNAVLLAAGAGVVLGWLLERGVPLLAGILGSLMIVINPVSLTFIPTLMSEPLFILLSTVALVLASRDSESWQPLLLVGVLAGLAVAARSAGWALVASLFVAMVVSGKYWRLTVFLPGLAIGLAVLFGLKSGLPSAHNYVEGFVENLAHFNAAYVMEQGGALLAGWQELWGSTAGAVIIGLLVLPGLALGLKRGHAEAWYIVVSVFMLLAWPFPGQMGRFLWVLAPALLALVPLSLGMLPGRPAPRAATALVLGLVLLLSVPGGIGRTAERLYNPPGEGLNPLSRLADWTRPEQRETAMINIRVRQLLLEDADRIADLTGNLQCVHSELPALVSIRARRIAYASPWNSLDNFDGVNRQCRYYYLVPGALPGADSQTIQRFSQQHEELFRSTAPWDDSGASVLGIFYRLRDEAALEDGQAEAQGSE